MLADSVIYELSELKYMILDDKDLEIVIHFYRYAIKNYGESYRRYLDEEKIGALLCLKELINDYFDLCELISLGKEALEEGCDPIGVYIFGLIPVKELLIQLKYRYKDDFWKTLKSITFAGFLNKFFLGELFEAHYNKRLKAKIRQLEQEREKALTGGIFIDRDYYLLYTLTGYSISYSVFYKHIHRVSTLRIYPQVILEPFEIEVASMAIKFTDKEIDLIRKWQEWIKVVKVKYNEKSLSDIKEEAIICQKLWDNKPVFEIEKDLVEKYIALAIKNDEGLFRDITSDDFEIAITHIAQLLFDRFESAKMDVISNPDRLRELGWIKKWNITVDYNAIINYLYTAKENLKKLREAKRSELKNFMIKNEKNVVKSLSAEIGKINKELMSIAEKEDIIKFNSKFIRDICTKIRHIIAKKKKNTISFCGAGFPV